MTRRKRFRAYMANVEPATDPRSAIERGLYIHPPTALANQIVARYEIEPTSRQLIVGGIGSGKTTQLLVCAEALNRIDDLAATYIDVSSIQDLGKLRPGCLVTLAANELLAHVENIDKKLTERVVSRMIGYRDPYAFEPTDDDDWIPGIITPPEPDWSNIDSSLLNDLKALVDAVLSKGTHFIFLFDSMDRMTDHNSFSQIVQEDISALHNCGLGVVVVGPIRSLEGFGRVDADRFDHLHFLLPIQVDTDVDGFTFLDTVLQCRATVDDAMHGLRLEILGTEARRELIRRSGGVLRDVMSLAKLAGEEAYLSGAEMIELEHARRAVDRFGRSLLMGLQPSEVEKLKRISESGRFIQVSESDIALLATRRVLKYGDRSTVYRVHPCIEPLLDDVGASDENPF